MLVPKLKNEGYVPFFVVERKRSEQALIQVVQEAFINGVSTRKIEHLAQSLGIENLSASQVSEINKGLNEQVEAFRCRPVERKYLVLWIYAMHEKIRMDGRVVNAAVLIVTGITVQESREVLAVEPMYNESEDTYTVLFEKLKATWAGKGMADGLRCPQGATGSHFQILSGSKLATLPRALHEKYSRPRESPG